MYDVLDIIKNIQSLYESNSSFAALKDFERVLDEMDLYVYDNWEDGEIAYGPIVDRHWITVGIMWPKNKMPDPVGAKRIVSLGCKVKYQKSHLLKPRDIKTNDDIRPGTKKGKLDRQPIWVVEIQMPRKVAFDMYEGYMTKIKNSKKPASNDTLPNGAAPTTAAMPSSMAPPMPGGMPSPMPGGMPSPMDSVAPSAMTAMPTA